MLEYLQKKLAEALPARRRMRAQRDHLQYKLLMANNHKTELNGEATFSFYSLKQQKYVPLISVEISNLKTTQDVDDWLADALSKILELHPKWPK